MGRKPKPMAEHLASGTYRADRHGRRLDLRVAPGVPERPTDLKGDAADCWDRLVEGLPEGVLCPLDAQAMWMYCQTWAMYRRVAEAMQDGPTDRAVRLTWSRCVDTLDKLGRQFGWSPSSRASLRLPAENEPEGVDLFEQFMLARVQRKDEG